MSAGPANPLVKELFRAVVDLEPADRAAYLDQHCSLPAVREEVEELLRLNDQTTETMLRPALEQLAVLPRKETEFAPFEKVDEFRVLRRLGEGGMAVVYLAEDTTLERLVALKVLPTAYTRSEERVARFRKEAVTIAQLHHEGIVPVHRVGFDRGVYYIAMEYVEGLTLAQALDDLRRLPAADARREIRSVSWLKQQAAMAALVADALDHTHRRGIVHRDVKPSNILLTGDGRPRLTDFGIARDLSRDDMTASGHFAGTYSYMSPEQARARGSVVDARTDVFSLGVVLYEALSLELPFGGDTVQEILNQVLSKQPRRLRLRNPAVSKDLETICHKALEKSPDHRYQTAAHFAADLRCFVDDRPILARPPSVLRRARVWVRDHRLVTLAAALVMLLVAVATLGFVLAGERRARMATVSIDSDRPGAVVSARRVNPATLELLKRTVLGSVPITRRLLPRGNTA